MKSTPQAVVLLGVNGTLSSAVITGLRGLQVAPHVIGFDVQRATQEPVHEYYRCDLRRRSAIRSALRKIRFEHYSDLRLLICSSVMNLVSLDSGQLDEDRFYEDLQINLGGQVHFATVFAQHAIAAGAQARVVFVGSTAASVGSNDIAYAAAKAGLNGAALSLSKYYASRGVTAGVVHTGIFDSPMSAAVSQQRKDKTLSMMHVKRVGELEEIRRHVHYYLMDAPEFSTGFITQINGGQHT